MSFLSDTSSGGPSSSPLLSSSVDSHNDHNALRTKLTKPTETSIDELREKEKSTPPPRPTRSPKRPIIINSRIKFPVTHQYHITHKRSNSKSLFYGHRSRKSSIISFTTVEVTGKAIKDFRASLSPLLLDDNHHSLSDQPPLPNIIQSISGQGELIQTVQCTKAILRRLSSKKRLHPRSSIPIGLREIKFSGGFQPIAESTRTEGTNRSSSASHINLGEENTERFIGEVVEAFEARSLNQSSPESSVGIGRSRPRFSSLRSRVRKVSAPGGSGSWFIEPMAEAPLVYLGDRKGKGRDVSGVSNHTFGGEGSIRLPSVHIQHPSVSSVYSQSHQSHQSHHSTTSTIRPGTTPDHPIQSAFPIPQPLLSNHAPITGDQGSPGKLRISHPAPLSLPGDSIQSFASVVKMMEDGVNRRESLNSMSASVKSKSSVENKSSLGGRGKEKESVKGTILPAELSKAHSQKSLLRFRSLLSPGLPAHNSNPLQSTPPPSSASNQAAGGVPDSDKRFKGASLRPAPLPPTSQGWPPVRYATPSRFSPISSTQTNLHSPHHSNISLVVPSPVLDTRVTTPVYRLNGQNGQYRNLTPVPGLHHTIRNVSRTFDNASPTRVGEEGEEMVEIPRFKKRDLNLSIVAGGSGQRIAWVGLWCMWVMWGLAGLFFDVNTVYMFIQCARKPSGPDARNGGWLFGAAAYAVCWSISILAVWLGWEVWFEFWRRWKQSRPAIEPIYTSLPASLHLSLTSYQHFAFFLHVRSSGISTTHKWDVLPETAHLLLQTITTLIPVLPRASLALVLLVNFWDPPPDLSMMEIRDSAFWTSDGSLTSYADGVLLAFTAITALRILIVIISALIIWIFSAPPSKPTTQLPRGARFTGTLKSIRSFGSISTLARPPSTPSRRGRDPALTMSPSKGWANESDLVWEWRERSRNRLQDGYELCMIRRTRSSMSPKKVEMDVFGPSPEAGRNEKRKKEIENIDMEVIKENNEDQEGLSPTSADPFMKIETPTSQRFYTTPKEASEELTPPRKIDFGKARPESSTIPPISIPPSPADPSNTIKPSSQNQVLAPIEINLGALLGDEKEWKVNKSRSSLDPRAALGRIPAARQSTSSQDLFYTPLSRTPAKDKGSDVEWVNSALESPLRFSGLIEDHGHEGERTRGINFPPSSFRRPTATDNPYTANHDYIGTISTRKGSNEANDEGNIRKSILSLESASSESALIAPSAENHSSYSDGHSTIDGSQAGHNRTPPNRDRSGSIINTIRDRSASVISHISTSPSLPRPDGYSKICSNFAQNDMKKAVRRTRSGSVDILKEAVVVRRSRSFTGFETSTLTSNRRKAWKRREKSKGEEEIGEFGEVVERSS